MSVPEILRLESQLRNKTGQRRTAEKGLPETPISARKRVIAATMRKMEFIDETFTGKLVISFKKGGVSYIEKIEQFK